MISVPVAIWLVRFTGAYLGIGLGFAVLFAFGLVNRMDPVAAHGTRPFRFLLLPGATLLWPLLVRRLIRGDTAPPIEHTAHRRFWLATLTAPVWKALHMLVYVAYGLLVAHIALGSLYSGRREHAIDRAEAAPGAEGWVDVCGVGDIREGRAKIAVVGGERVAVFRYDGKLSCVSNVCQHQNGPLGEGKIVDGCITLSLAWLPVLARDRAVAPAVHREDSDFQRAAAGRESAGTRVAQSPWHARAADIDSVTAMTDNDPFYVGYRRFAPSTIARGVRRVLIGLAAITMGSALLLASSQRKAEPGVFEYGHPRSVRGQVREFPYPMLLVPGSGLTDRGAAYTRYLLVAEGKRGAQSLVAGLNGQWARLTATRIARPEREMLEIAAGGVTVTPPDSNVRLGVLMPPPESVGPMTFSSEIVDSKCWLGVMKPARGNVHRGCAALCLSGGIAPLLVTVDSTGAMIHILLTGADGQPAHRRFAELVARTLTVRGEVIRDGNLLVMRVVGIED